eukprot:4054633-Pleurochrysis_carterae.AAC.3
MFAMLFHQTLLGNLPDKLAMKGEMLLIDLIVEVVPPSSLARFMERLALFSHLPPIRACSAATSQALTFA